jgi:hypothetical protein
MKKEKVLTKKSAMQLMYEELIAHEYTIPLELVVKCKELIQLEKEQIIETFKYGKFMPLFTEDYNPEEYYNLTFGGENEQD